MRYAMKKIAAKTLATILAIGLLGMMGNTAAWGAQLDASAAKSLVTLKMTPSAPSINVAGTVTVTVELEAGAQEVTNGSVFVSFDPAALQVNKITLSDTFTVPLAKKFDNTAGTLQCDAGQLGEPFPTGTFTYCSIVFNAVGATGSEGTPITFDRAGTRTTMVYAPGAVEVLGDVTNTSVVVNSATPPHLTLLNPDHGSTAGGNDVTITGTGLNQVTAVAFGVTAATIKSKSDTQIVVTAPAHAAGTADVGTTPAADNPTLPYTYTPPNPPHLTLLNPDHGSTAGGNDVTITGTGLNQVTAVAFGVTAATIKSKSDTQIVVTAPAHAAGTADVGTTPAADNPTLPYAYSNPSNPPHLALLNPDHGSTAGGNDVTITGTGFNQVTAVAFGVTAATIKSKSDTQIVVTAPAHAAGTADVGTTPAADNPTLPYTYTPPNPPHLALLNPDHGSTAGGNDVTITGTGLNQVTAVAFGVTAATIKSKSDTQIVVTAPAHAAGTADVGTTPAADNPTLPYTYTPPNPPHLALLNPDHGSTAGGNDVTITGTGLNQVTAVAFGVTAATIKSKSDTQIVVTTPAHAAGTADVGTTPAADNPTLPYTYNPPNPPHLALLNPDHGSTAGGNDVTITGTGLNQVTAVAFGVTAATIKSKSDTQIVVTAPAHAAGTADVGTTPAADNPTLPYAYSNPSNPPHLALLNPDHGSTAGGNDVTITGTGLNQVTAVAFGVTAATIKSKSDTQIVVTAPAHAAGTADVGTTPAADNPTLPYTYNSGDTGEITATLSPQAAIQGGAYWNVNDGSWQSSGATVAPLPPGLYTVHFQPIPGFGTPPDSKVNVIACEAVTVEGKYTAPGSLQVTISPPSALNAGAMWQVDGGSGWKNSGETETNLSAGDPPHTVAFSTVNGFGKPSEMTVRIVENDIVRISASYTPCTAPLRPQNLEAVPMDGRSGLIHLTWTAVDGATSYKVYSNENPGQPLATVTDTAYDYTGAPLGHDYYNPSGCAGTLDSMGCINSANNPGCYELLHQYGTPIEYYVTAVNDCDESPESEHISASAYKSYRVARVLTVNGDMVILMALGGGLWALARRSESAKSRSR